MPRLEAIINTPLSFRQEVSEGGAQYSEPPESVAIDFDRRQLVWHVFADDPTLGPHGPTITSVLGGDDDAVVATEVERFLSALTFLYDVPAQVAHYGSSSTDEPFEEPISRGPLAPGWARKKAPVWMRLRRDSDGLLKALGWYREGRSSDSPYYRFLAHWNALEAVFYGPGAERDRASFIDRVAPGLAAGWAFGTFPASPSDHFRQASRNAISHVFRTGGQLLDPDADADRRRLDDESRFLQVLVSPAIREVFGEPVEVGWA
jgi:hypothetical protein